MAKKKQTDMAFARKLTAAREEAGLSIYALAKQAGLSLQAVTMLEKGGRDPTWDTIQKLSKALGVSCETFRVDG